MCLGSSIELFMILKSEIKMVNVPGNLMYSICCTSHDSGITQLINVCIIGQQPSMFEGSLAVPLYLLSGETWKELVGCQHV